MLRLKLPGLLEGKRKLAFLALLAITLGEVLAQLAAAAALKAILVGVAVGHAAALALIVAGGTAAALAWARGIAGERFGQCYVNQTRTVLAHQATRVAAGGGPGRFGTLAIRMTGDLAAIKDWANIGVCGGLAGVLGLAGGLLAAWMAAGSAGLVAGSAGLVIALLAAAACWQALVARQRERRRHKGRLAAKIGDLLLGAQTSAAYAAEHRAIRPVQRAGEAVLRASCREAGIAGLLSIPAMLTVPLGAATAVWLDMAGLSLTDGIAGWAALLFALSLIALAIGLLAKSMLQFTEYRIARERLLRLLVSAGEAVPTAPQGEIRLPPGRALMLCVDGEVLLEAGAVSICRRSDIDGVLSRILRGDRGVTVDGLSAADVYSIDWPRRIGYAGPMRPLKRGRLRQMLAAKRDAHKHQAELALDVAGLDRDLLDENPLLDPAAPNIAEWMLARLRLARALSHYPRALIVDDPWLVSNAALVEGLVKHCQKRGISLLLVQESDDTDSVADVNQPTLVARRL